MEKGIRPDWPYPLLSLCEALGSLVDPIAFATPVGLEQDAVDLFEIDGLRLIAYGLHHGCNAEIAYSS